MASVGRDYSVPDVIRTVYSTESDSCTEPLEPFKHQEVAQRRLGYFTGGYLPGWKRMRNEGKLLPLQYYVRYDEISSQSGSRRLVWERSGTPKCFRTASIASCGILEDFDLFTSDRFAFDYIAKFDNTGERLLQSAASDILSDFDALTFLAELRQVKEMFLSAAPRLLKQLLAKPTSKVGASAWLQWQMGWKPLISDIESIVQIINNTKEADRIKKTKTSSKSESLPINMTKVLPNGERHTVTGTTSISLNVRATCIADISALANNAYINPLSTAWELIPYSFLVDYFVGIGDWIRANSLVVSGVNYTAAVGYDFTLSRTVSLRGGPPPSGSLIQYDADGNASVYAKMKLRVPRTISLAKPPPINEDSQSVTRIINMIALALQKVR